MTTKKEKEPFYTDKPTICPITNKEYIDDVHIVVEFGYGSPKDMWPYKLSPVHHDVGQKVLEYIESLAQEHNPNFDIEDYGEDTIEDCFDADWELSDQQKAEWGFDD